ncbi:MAG: hypothetical protein HYZ28_12440 [Myxococcales bacterium]|nr:hypothetical protein [Myxococcales bacterium]
MPTLCAVHELQLLSALSVREPGFLVGGLVVAAVALAVFLWGRSNAHRHRRMAETRTSQVSSLMPGFAEVKGRASPAGLPLESPLSKTPCIYYRFQVEEHRRRGKRSYWRTVIDDRREAGLVVFDGTGRVAVRLSEAELHLAPDAHARSGVFNDAPTELEATLSERYGRSSVGWVFNKTMRYTETLLREGEEIYVLGTVGSGPAGLEFCRGNDLFIVTDKSEEDLSAKFHRNAVIGSIIGTIFGIGALFLAGVAFAL